MCKLRIYRIVRDTAVDGVGWRTTIYCSGCSHECPGCHNPATWDIDSGETKTIDEVLEFLSKDENNVTFSGGDPMYQAVAFTELARRIVEEQHKTIWCYTGFTYEQVIANRAMSRMLTWIEVLVDGPFIEYLRDTNLLFRGSSNQRLIDVQASMAEGRAIEWKYNPFPQF
ncbi:MAG: anaerobic ribonucleoside-triphosphate reductase activating protein [Paludibacteraceae bacterium]|nr:anaerobic ribonucleoside-triphosphate reductase activating protein [Paludibacteraceae bacterium]